MVNTNTKSKKGGSKVVTSETKANEIARQVADLIGDHSRFIAGVESVEYQDLESRGQGAVAPARVLIHFTDGSHYELLVKRWH